MSNTEVADKNVEEKAAPATVEASPPVESPPVESPAVETSPLAEQPPDDSKHVIVKTEDKSDETPEATDKSEVQFHSDDSNESLKRSIEVRKTILDEGYDDVLRPDRLERGFSDSDESNDSVGSYVRQKTLVFAPDFFEILGNVPDMSEISEDVSIAFVIERISRPSIAHEVIRDEGKFVDPVTGVPLESSEEEVPEPPPSEVVEEEEEEEEGEEEEGEDDELLKAQEVEEDADLAKQEEQDVFVTFLEIETENAVVVEEAVDWEALEREAAARRLQENTEEFIDMLIARVVEKCEYVNPATILRENLDKEQLMRELEDKLLIFDIEQRSRQFLNRKTVEYFRRKKAFRDITEDSPEIVQQEIYKYKEAINNLDLMLGRENETKTKTGDQMDTLQSELYKWQQNCREEIYKLEELMRKTLIRENFDRLKTVLDGILARMSQLRDEVTQCRYILLQRQHTFAVLVEKLNKLEDLGNGLRMRDFEHLQTETQALGKKIEERNAELSKLRTRCNADLHIMAHMREKQQMIRNTISIQDSALQDLLDDKQFYREHLYALKLARERVRKEIHELSFQGGLLDKPALMLDFDDTSERLDKLRARVENLRSRYADVQQKIQNIEKKCDVQN